MFCEERFVKRVLVCVVCDRFLRDFLGGMLRVKYFDRLVSLLYGGLLIR